MTIDVLAYGMFDSNSYIVSDNGEAILVDAGVEAEEIKKVLDKRNAKLKYILLTHGHIDHIVHTDSIKKLYGGEVVINIEDAECLINPSESLGSMMGLDYVFDKADIIVNDNDKLEFGNSIVEVIHTPGHSPGSVCFKIGGNLFSGDTLFNQSIGRYDFPKSDGSKLFSSIKDKLFTLPNDTKVYPGHGDSTSIVFEKENNPFFQ